MLVQAAAPLCGVARVADTLAGVGGDTFILLLDDLSSEPDHAAAQGRQVGEKLRLGLAQPFWVEGNEFHCTGSIGIQLTDNGTGSETLTKRADLATYQAKTTGRNAVRFFRRENAVSRDESRYFKK